MKYTTKNVFVIFNLKIINYYAVQKHVFWQGTFLKQGTPLNSTIIPLTKKFQSLLLTGKMFIYYKNAFQCSFSLILKYKYHVGPQPPLLKTTALK